MDLEKLRALWADTLAGEDSAWDGLETEVTYRQPNAETVPLGPGFALPDLRLPPSDEAFAPGEEIGRGGMGVVFRARQSSLSRDVALKRQLGPEVSPVARASFLSEALITGRLEHPNIVPVYDLGQTRGGDLHLAMKLVEGRSWDQLLETERDLTMHLEILLQVCNAIAYAHSRGVLHNDLKPDNVMLGSFGEVLVMDWGVAVELDGSDTPATGLRSQSTVKNPCGTPAYMPPELAEGRGADLGPWTDVYLLGGILYRVLSGAPPHRGKTFFEVVAQAARGEVPPLPEEHPEELRALCAKALAPRPEDRFPSVRALQTALRAFLRHKEALELAGQARARLARCDAQAAAGEPRRHLYEGFTEALTLFGQARRLWEHDAALEGLRAAHEAYARAALAADDLGLADAQLARLEALGAEPAELRATLGEARDRRLEEARARRRLVSIAGLALLAVLAVAGGFLWRDHARSAGLRAARLASIRALEAELDGREPAVAEARAHLAGLTRSQGRIALEAAERATNAALLSRLLGLAQDQERLLDLYDAPVDGALLALVEPAVREAAAETLLTLRGLAVELAIAAEAHELAAQIIADTPAPPARLAPLHKQLEEARGALLAWQLATTAEALADLRAGRDRPERAAGAPTPQEYLIRLSGFRDKRVVALLAEALAPYAERARREATARRPVPWSQAEREEIRLILETLGYLELPGVTVPVLEDFLTAVWDHDLAVTCGEALCNTRSQAGTEAVLRIGRARFDLNSETWRQISRRFNRVPPPALDTTASASDFLERALFFRFRGDEARALADYDRALALEPQNATAYLNRGNLFALLGREADALADYARALERAPFDPKIFLNRGLVYRGRGDDSLAFADFGRAIELAPALPQGYANRAAIHVDRGEPEAAIADFSAALERAPDDARNYVNRATQHLLLGQVKKAAEDCDAALARDRRNREAYATRAEARRQQGDLHGALADVTRALALSPQYRVGYLRRGQILTDLGEAERALVDFEKAVELDPDSTDGYFFRSDARQRLGELDGAIADMEEVLARAPGDPMALQNLALLLQRAGDLDGAVALWEMLLEAGSLVDALAAKASTAYSARAQARLVADRLAAARADATRAIELWEGNHDGYTLRSVIGRIEGRHAEAVADATASLALNPHNALVHGNRGAARLQLGDFEGAIADFDALLAEVPEDRFALELRGEARAALGDLEGAVADWGAALVLAPDQHQLRYQRALAALHAGLLEPSRLEHDRLLRLDAANPGLLLSRAIVHALAEDPDAARADLERALELAPQVHIALWLAGLCGDTAALAALEPPSPWQAALRGLFLGELSGAGLLAREELGDPARACEAHGFLGMWYEQQGEIAAAREQYAACLASGRVDFQEYAWALNRLRLLEEP